MTLGAAAPAGGAVVTLASSNVGVAASMPSLIVPQGANTASFTVATNPRYRKYSGLAFSVTISATRVTTQSATLSVTAQPRPPDFNSGSQAGANTQWQGLMCGGIAPIGGNTEILYDCSPATGTGFGSCTFREECSLGCRRVPPSGGTFSDFCATSGPNPVAVSRTLFVSGDHVPATVVTEAPVTIPTTGVPIAVSLEGNARSFSPVDVGGLHFPSGASSMPFDVATSYVPTIEFVDVATFWYDDDIPPFLITNGRGGHAWVAMVPPDPPPTQPIPTPVQFKIVGLDPVTGGQSSHGTVHLSGIPHGIGPTITLTSSHPAIASAVPDSITPPAGNILGFDVSIETHPPAADTDVTITATDGRYTFSDVLRVLVPPPPPVLAGVSVNPTSVVGGNPSTGTVTLSAAQTGPTVVQVSIIDSAPATLPSNNPPCPPSSRCHNVTVPAGATSASFTIATSPVTGQFNLNVNANLAGSPGRTALLLITPGGPLTLSTLTLNPTSVTGGASVTGTVTLNGPAPTGGAVVTLSRDNTAATVPASVTVPAGQTSASFTVTTSAVTATTNVRISATFNGATANADMTLWALLSALMFPGNHPGGTPATGTIFLSAPAPAGGAVVALSSANTSLVTVPPSATVPAGQTSATFTANTAPVSTLTGVVVSASLNGTTVTETLFLVASRAVTSVTLNPSSVSNGNPSTGTVTLASSSGGNASVALSSSNTLLAVVPSGVVVPSGQASATFTVNTAPVSTTTTVVISATNEGVTRSATLTLTPSSGGGSPGFNSPSANAADSGGDGNGFESGPANAHGDDAASATDTNSGSGTSTSCTSSSKDRHRFFNYGFSVPTGASINGIEVRLDARADSTSSSPKMCVQLSWDGGTTWTAAKSTGTLGTSLATFTLGGATDTWGRTWSAGNFADASFRVRVIDVSSSTSRDFFLDWVAVRPHFTVAGPASLSTVSLSPATVVGGSPSTGTATLSAAAPAGGAAVSLSSSNTAAATVPATVTIAAGATSATFTVTTVAVGANTNVTVSGTYGGATRSAALTVTPPPPAASLSALSLSPTSVTGGSPSTGSVTLTSGAPAGGVAVSLASSNTGAATVPASVTVPAGATSATFTVATQTVGAGTSAIISGTYSGVTRSATLTVNPQAGDTVAIQRAEYDDRDEDLRVEATSTSSNATLQVFVTSTNQLIGTLSNNGGGRYSRTFSWPTNPQSITVRSSLGGSASRNVTLD